MINILIRITAEGAKAAAPHVARHAHHLVRHAHHVVRHVARLLFPKLAGGASAGAVGSGLGVRHVRGGKGVPTGTHHTPVKPHARSNTSTEVEHFAEGTAEEIVAAEGLTRGGKAVYREIRKVRHEGPGESAQPAAA